MLFNVSLFNNQPLYYCYIYIIITVNKDITHKRSAGDIWGKNRKATRNYRAVIWGMFWIHKTPWKPPRQLAWISVPLGPLILTQIPQEIVQIINGWEYREIKYPRCRTKHLIKPPSRLPYSMPPNLISPDAYHHYSRKISEIRSEMRNQLWIVTNRKRIYAKKSSKWEAALEYNPGHETLRQD